MAIPSPPPTAVALRMRTYRKRRRNGMRYFSVLLHESEVAGLVSKGYLDGKARRNRQAVQRALDEYVCELVPLNEWSDA